MQNNGNGEKKLNEALKRAAEEKGKAFEKAAEIPVAAPSHVPEPKPELKSEDFASEVNRKIVVYHNPTSQVSEQFRAMSAHVRSMEMSEGIKTIAVTSPTCGEGKSVVAVNMAVVMALDFSKPVVLIDCNMRRPSVGPLLGLHNSEGLSDLLSGRAQLQDVLIKTDVANLTVLPGGETALNPNELLASSKMVSVLSELKRQFEVVILDTPAVIPYADPRILSKIAEGVILVIRTGKTRREVVGRAENILNSVGANILGYVLTGIEYHIPEYIHRHL